MLRSRCAACRGKAAVDAVRVAVQYRTMVDRAESRGGPLMKKRNSDDTVIIKKYANRRLYNTETSSYLTLEHLAAMTREGRAFKVVDAKTDADITHNVPTQNIMAAEPRGPNKLTGN